MAPSLAILMEMKKGVNEEKERKRNDNDFAILGATGAGWHKRKKERIISVFIPDMISFATVRLHF